MSLKTGLGASTCCGRSSWVLQRVFATHRLQLLLPYCGVQAVLKGYIKVVPGAALQVVGVVTVGSIHERASRVAAIRSRRPGVDNFGGLWILNGFVIRTASAIYIRDISRHRDLVSLEVVGALWRIPGDTQPVVIQWKALKVSNGEMTLLNKHWTHNRLAPFAVRKILTLRLHSKNVVAVLRKTVDHRMIHRTDVLLFP